MRTGNNVYVNNCTILGAGKRARCFGNTSLSVGEGKAIKSSIKKPVRVWMFKEMCQVIHLICRSFSRLIVTNLLKIVGLSLSLAFFSLSGFAEITAFPCEDANQQSYNEYKSVYENDPGNVRKIYNMSMEAICLGKMAEGMPLLERSSDGGHVVGSYFMGVYYKTDKTFDINRRTTRDPENFNATLFYYKRAVAQIEANPNYPEGTYSNIPYLEEHNQTSVRAFTMTPMMYYRGYIDAIMNMLNDSVVYTDTLEALEKMKQFSEQCLARPSLSVWKEKQEHAYQVMQVRCQAMRDFSIKVYPLEQERIGIAEECVGSLKNCSEHGNILDNEIAPLMNQMAETYKSISL